MTRVELYIYTLLNRTNPPADRKAVELDKMIIQMSKSNNTELFNSCYKNAYPVYEATGFELDLETYVTFLEEVHEVLEELGFAYQGITDNLTQGFKVIIDQLYESINLEEEG